MLSSDDIKGYIGEYERQKIGVVFFEVKDEDCLVSINLNPKFRGRKLSTVLLRDSLKKSRSITHRTNFFIAKIKEINLASIKTFEHNGFTFVYRDNNSATYKLDTKKWFEEKNV